MRVIAKPAAAGANKARPAQNNAAQNNNNNERGGNAGQGGDAPNDTPGQ